MVIWASIITAALSGWELTWHDEFDSASLNTTAWDVKSNRTHCCGPKFARDGGELELYTTDEVMIENSQLVLRTRRRKMLGPGGKVFNFTSGWLDTDGRFAQKYGRFEANCSVPPRNATGVWPAFWLLPQNKSQCWPTGGEVDIFEFNGDWVQDRAWGSYHWALPGQCGKDKAPIPGKGYKPASAGSNWQEDFHVYAVEWYPDR
jgi:beta-glucanase (GH16 family)